MSKVPEFVPVLSYGAHENPAEGACFMEMASFLAGEEFSDSPDCTHPVIAAVARYVNDMLDDDNRHLIVPLIPLVIGTVDLREDEQERRRLSYHLATWCTERAASESLNLKILDTNLKSGNSYPGLDFHREAAGVALNATSLIPVVDMPEFLRGLIDYHARLTRLPDLPEFTVEDARKVRERMLEAHR